MNKIEVVTTNFALDKATFDKKLELLDFSDKMQLDFMDGEFTTDDSVSLENMSSINNVKGIDFELHMMAKNPTKYLDQIKKLNVKKILFHVEGCQDKGDVERTI